MSNVNLINPNTFGIKSNSIWWASQEAKDDYNVTEDELKKAGITSTVILIDKSLISPLKKVNAELANYNLEIEIDDGFRSPELYYLASLKVAQKKGTAASASLFNLDKMPHSSGKSIDVALVNTVTRNREVLFDKSDGVAASFLGFYDKFEDIKSQNKVKFQKLLGAIMLSNNFEYGTKNEVWHFDYVGEIPLYDTNTTQIPSNG